MAFSCRFGMLKRIRWPIFELSELVSRASARTEASRQAGLGDHARGNLLDGETCSVDIGDMVAAKQCLGLLQFLHALIH